ncbi:MAG: PAS domain S-box protein, partial [Candidatus Scalindua sp.]|nr:PAS domain S-box protein [Candidatus Scalindua sp.]
MELIAKHDCIYIIDDNTHSLTVLKNLLLDLNYSVRVANRGSVAIKSILMDPPDLIILDLIMPDMDGYEVCKELRNNQNTKDIPIIFVSALDEIESKVKALNTGGNDYITKPYHIEEVSARIQTHLYIRKLQKKLESKNTQLSQEIIERKQVEVQISKLSQAIKEIPSTFMITDIKGNIEFVNPSFTKLTGYTSKEIVGQSSRILKSGKTTTEEYKRMWKTITTGGTWRGELSNKKKDGELYWESASISSMKDPDGVISNFIKVAEDITERRKIDAERLRLSKILEMTSDLVSTATVDGNVTYMNFSGRQMVGWNDDFNVSTKKIQDAHPEHAFNIIKNEVIPYVMKNGVWEGETALINSEGREIPVSQVIMLHRSPERKAEFLSTIMRDISDRNQIENELLKKNSFLNLLQVAAVAANEAEDINDAFLPILEEICRNTGWEIGHAYAISENDPDLLKPTEVWCLEEQKPYIDFCNITKKTDFARGVGLPGRVLSSGKPHWIENVLEDSNFLRKQIALDLNIHSGIAFPVIVKHSVVAVLEFFTTRKEKPDQQFMEIMADVGTNLGRVVERSRAKEAVVQSEKRLRSYFDLGLIGMALTSLQKGWIEFNDTLCSMLGYTRNDFAKLTWTELTHPDDLESDLAQFNRVIAGEVDGYSIEKRFI